MQDPKAQAQQEDQVMTQANSEQEEGFNFHESLGRIGPFSVADTLSTAVGGYFLAKATGWDTAKTIVGLFVAGELAHLAVGIETPVTKFLKEQFE